MTAFAVVPVSKMRWRIAKLEDKDGVLVAVFISGKHRNYGLALEACRRWQESFKFVEGQA